MTRFLVQWSYGAEQFKALINAPHDRGPEFRKIIEAFGGSLHDYYFAFGDFDGVAIVDFADETTCAACMMSVASSGAARHLKTTVLVTPSESVEAMRRAKAARHGYVTPVGYASIG